MQITEEQKRILNTLTCERLSSNPNNLREVGNFYNWRNRSLEHTLKDSAYEEDEADHIAYYLFKDADGADNPKFTIYEITRYVNRSNA